MDKKCGIYCILNLVNGKVYVGQSHDIEHRWKTEINGHRINNHLRSAFKKFGLSKFSFFILEECLSSELSYKERFYIALYKSYDRDFGYNKTLGGEGSLGHVPSEETRKKVSIANKGRKFSQEQLLKVQQNAREKSEKGICGKKVYCYETKEIFNSCALAAKALGISKEGIRKCVRKIAYSVSGYHFCALEEKDTFLPNFNPRLGRKGHAPSEYCLQRIREANTGRIKSPEERAKLSKAHKGKKLSEEHKAKIRAHARHTPMSEEHKKLLSISNSRRMREEGKCKPVYCLETDTVYDSISMAAKENNIDDDMLVSRCCRKKLKSAKGKHFCFAKDKDTFVFDLRTPSDIYKEKKGKKVYCVELDLIFKSIHELVDTLVEYKFNRKGVADTCKGLQESHKGYHFKFVN